MAGDFNLGPGSVNPQWSGYKEADGGKNEPTHANGKIDYTWYSTGTYHLTSEADEIDSPNSDHKALISHKALN
jgi:hypothetical protein